MKVSQFLCHGRPNRCLSVGGYRLAVCARCTALYLGMVSGLLVELAYGLPSTQFVPVLLLMVLPTAVDGATQLLGKRESTNRLRVTTGYPAGIGFILLLRIVVHAP